MFAIYAWEDVGATVNGPGNPQPVYSEHEKVVSEWRSIFAMSLYVGGGVHLIKAAKLYMCTQNAMDVAIMCLLWFRTQGLCLARLDRQRTVSQVRDRPCQHNTKSEIYL